MLYCVMEDGESDIFLINDGQTIRCHRCKLQQRRSELRDGDEVMVDIPPIIQVRFDSRAEALAHLDEHMARGHLVPRSVMQKIRAEIQEVGYAVS